MNQRYQKILDEYDETTRRLSETKSRDEYKTLGKKQRELDLAVTKIRSLSSLESQIHQTQKLKNSGEQDIAELAESELGQLEKQKQLLLEEIENMLLPKDPLDEKNAIVEIRAAAGGNEASLFAAELFRMYGRYAESHNWRTALISANRNEVGGFKEIIFEVLGDGPYGLLKFESGVQRVQRVPVTEKSGRVHTSTATVAVLPIIEEDEFMIDPKDLKIETSTSRGAGGQSVNTTYSSIKITHLPTGITAQSQDERSQLQNRARAMQVLTSRVFAHMQEQKQKELTAQRRAQIGSGDRSEKIRTYNFPQDRVTDHRINQSFKQITEILDGKLDPLLTALAEANKNLSRAAGS